MFIARDSDEKMMETADGVFLLLDNARLCTAVETHEEIDKLSFKVIPRLPYSLDSASCDFYAFRTIRVIIKMPRSDDEAKETVY